MGRTLLSTREISVYVFFLAVSLLIFLGRWQGCSPVVNLGYDAGNVATVAAMCDYPEQFARPYPKIGPFCRYSHLAFVETVRRVEDVVGDFGTATVVLHIPFTFSLLVGFYWLGRELWKRDIAAALFALLHIPIVWIHVPEGTFWGIYDDPWARHMHQAVLPFFLWAAIRYRHQPRRWPLIVGLSGLSAVFHYRSGALWTLALWLGFFALAWRQRRERPHVLRSFLVTTGVFALFVAALGTLVAYTLFGGWERVLFNAGVSETTLERMYQTYRSQTRFGPWLFLLYWFMPVRFAVLWMAVVGAGWLFYTGGPGRRELLWMMGGWVLGILAFSLGLGLMSPRFSAAVYHAYTLRGLRYLIPLALLFAFWLGVQAWDMTRESWGRLPRRCKVTGAIGLLFPWWMLVLHPLTRLVHGRTLETWVVNKIAVYYTPPAKELAWLRPFLVKAVRWGMDWLLLEQIVLVTAFVSAWWWWKHRPAGETWLRLAKRLGRAAVVALVVLWFWVHDAQGGVALMKSGLRLLVQGPPVCETPQRLAFAYAIPTFVPPKQSVFTPIKYPWAISYVGLRHVQGGLRLRSRVKTVERTVTDPKARWQKWLEMARKHKATYMLTNDIPVDIVASSPEVEMLWGEGTWALVRLLPQQPWYVWYGKR